jgi:nicotinamide-nucleotide amidase
MSTTDRDLEELALKLGRALHVRGWRLGVAESCTGGWIAKVLTDVAGSSQWFDGGVVAYSNAAKIELLGVPSETLAGPGGGTPDKPVGTVHFAWAAPDRVIAARRIFPGSRETVRRHTVALALERLVDLVSDDERQA